MWGTGDPKIGILMGSPGDREQLEEGIALLQEFGVGHEVHVLSAHRNPDKVRQYASEAEGRGIQVLICAAGLAAHLAGAVAAQTTLPVIGIPIQGGPLNGLDALLSTVQMPRGIPVASMAIGKHGAVNAVLFALEILALQEEGIRGKLKQRREEAAR
jgi:5-(carboxyamino)imidazole ribonucleotide mutase